MAAEIAEVHDGGSADKVEEKLRDGRASSSSDSEDEKAAAKSAEASLKAKVRRLFGRERPVYHVLGGGKSADVMLWRNKKISAGVLGIATVVWILFELLEYHLIPLIADGLIFSLASLFLWSNAKAFIRKSPPCIPEVRIPEGPVVKIARSLSYEINRAFVVLREIASGRSLKKFLVVIAGLWVLSVLGSSADFLTLFYILFVILHTVPVLYEKYDDKVDAFAEKVMDDVKKHYAAVDKVLISMIHRGSPKNKKQQ